MHKTLIEFKERSPEKDLRQILSNQTDLSNKYTQSCDLIINSFHVWGSSCATGSNVMLGQFLDLLQFGGM